MDDMLLLAISEEKIVIIAPGRSLMPVYLTLEN